MAEIKTQAAKGNLCEYAEGALEGTRHCLNDHDVKVTIETSSGGHKKEFVSCGTHAEKLLSENLARLRAKANASI